MSISPISSLSEADASELDLENQRVFLRTDIDAPVGRTAQVTSDERICEAIPTIRALQAAGARIIVGSRFGEYRRGLGSLTEGDKAPSIEPAAARLSELLEMDVLLPDDCTGDAVRKVLATLREGQICVLENLGRRSDLGSAREALARQMLPQFDVYVGDSLRALTQPSATTTILPRLLETRMAGLTLKKELDVVARIRSQTDHPRLFIWGGRSLSGRLSLLKRLAGDTAQVLLVGVAANTMVRALGGAVGRSRIEESYLAGARTLHEQLGDRLLLPRDFVVAENSHSQDVRTVPAQNVPEHLMALDLGPQSLALAEEAIARAGMVLWCGSAGLYQEPAFSRGTRALVEKLSESSAFTVIAGDDTVAAARAVDPDCNASIDHLATGGDATLALLNENKLVGLEALRGTIS